MSACEKVIYAIPLDGARGILKKFPVGRRWRFQAEAGDADRSASHRLTWPSSAPRSEGVGIGLKRTSLRWRDDAVLAGLGGRKVSFTRGTRQRRSPSRCPLDRGTGPPRPLYTSVGDTFLRPTTDWRFDGTLKKTAGSKGWEKKF